MEPKEVNVELLLGRRVMSLNNRSAGRVEEVRGELRKGDCYVTEYLIGTYAAFERLAALAVGRAFLSLFGSITKQSYRVPWDKLDLSDPQRPRLKCRVEQLKRVE